MKGQFAREARFFLHPMRSGHGRKLRNDSEKTIIKPCKGYIEESKIFIFIYLFEQASKKFKNKRCMDKGHTSTDSIL
jgi:hypothetical protein